MKFSFLLVWIFILLLPVSSLSQKIQGNIRDETKNLIDAKIVLREKESPDFVKEFTQAKNGYFSYELQKEYTTIQLEFSAFGFINQIVYIENPDNTQVYKFDIVLNRKTDIRLEEIFIDGKSKPFKVKKDTIVFSVDAYKEDGDKKIEDVIKKLPGISVDDKTGEIRYLGKSISALTLDGDDLFGLNYALGSKNINASAIDKIEAIENFNDNVLLRNIEDVENVALNLQLKENNYDISGDLSASSGVYENIDPANLIEVSLLGVGKKYKSFAIASHNNIGHNKTPFDYFGNSQNIESLQEVKFHSYKVIPEIGFFSVVDDYRVNFNDQLFTNYNTILKIDDKSSLKVNLYYLQDKISSNQLTISDFQIGDDLFSTSDEINISKMPIQVRGDILFKYRLSKSELIEYDVKLSKEDIHTTSDILKNQRSPQKTILASDDFFFKQRIAYTKAFTEKTALQITANSALNDISQKYTLNPALLGDSSGTNHQQSQFRKELYNVNIDFFGKTENENKYSLKVGYEMVIDPFSSSLRNDQNNSSSQLLSENNFVSKQMHLFQSGTYNYNLGNWKFSPSYSLRYIKQDLDNENDNQNVTNSSVLFLPKLDISYRINRVSFVKLGGSFNSMPFVPTYFFSNSIVTSNRSSLQNLPSLELWENKNFSLLYFNNDLYNQFQLNGSLFYQIRNGNYFSNTTINERITQVTLFFSPQASSNISANVTVSKYIAPLETTLKLSNGTSFARYKNIVNDSEFRDSENFFNRASFFFKTAFDIPVNFENNLTWEYSTSRSIGFQTFSNQAMNNAFTTRFNISKYIQGDVFYEYYLPNTKNWKSSFSFLDLNFRFKLLKDNQEIGLHLKNVFNEHTFQSFQTSDFFKTNYSLSLLPRHFLISLNWSF